MDAQESRQTPALLLEIVDTQKRQLAQMARMLEIQRQDHEQARERMAQASAALLAGARQLGEGGQQLARDAMHAIEGESRQRLGEVLGKPLGDALLGIDQVARRVTQSGDVAARQMGELARAHQILVRVGLLWLGVGGLFLVAGSSLWTWHMGRQARQYGVEADLAARIERADVVKCGDGLCANIAMSARGQGDRQQYRPIRPRPDPEEVP